MQRKSNDGIKDMYIVCLPGITDLPIQTPKHLLQTFSLRGVFADFLCDDQGRAMTVVLVYMKCISQLSGAREKSPLFQNPNHSKALQ